MGPPPPGKLQGIVQRWTAKGYGFIAPEDGGEELFCHFSKIEDGNALQPGTIVHFVRQFDETRGNHRAVQIVTNNEALQKYAAQTMFVALEPTQVHETTVKVGGYVLGEFGYLIGEEEGTSGVEQFEVLQQHIAAVSPPTRALLLTALVKMTNL